MYLNKYSPQPKIGDQIKITWLPPNNAWPDKNCYIGWEGMVDYLFDNGGFCLYTESAVLIIGHKKFKYIKMDNTSKN